MDFFPGPPSPPDDEDVPEQPQPAWLSPPEDILPGIVPVELVLGRSRNAVVLLTGVRAFPSGLQLNLAVRVRESVRRGDRNGGVFDDPYRRGKDPDWQARRLQWGLEFADGHRVTSVDPWPDQPNRDHSRSHRPDDWAWGPDHPVLSGGGVTGGSRSEDRNYWLWPLPPPGRLRVVCQWPDQDIEPTVQDLDAGPFLDAGRARPIWPEG